MRIVALADTHLCTTNYRVPDGDLLIHAGDLCRAGRVDELVVAATWLAALPHARKLVVAGNHDWAFVRAPDKARELLGAATYLEDAAATIGGLRIYGAPWTPNFCGWAFNLARGAELAARWAHVPAGLDVLVTHGPPAGLGDFVGAKVGHVGCEDLRARVRDVKPRLHLFGHIHQDGGVWEQDGTVFANVTSDEGNRAPTVIDLDEHGLTIVDAPDSRR